MTTGANLGLEYGYVLGGAFDNNTQFQMLDGIVQGGVKDKDLAAPPGSPTAGDRYIVAASPTGAWAGQAGNIAVWQPTVSSAGSGSNAWAFYAPKRGWTVYVDDEKLLYRYEPSAWFVAEPWINVRAYGAVGDGVTDDTSAIQAAINAAAVNGGTVFFPKSSGAYVRTTITIPSNVSILTEEISGQRIFRGDIPTSSGKMIFWNSQDVSLSPSNALIYDPEIIQNQLSVNLRAAGTTKIPVGIYSWVNVEGDLSAGQAAKNPNAVFGQIDVNGPSPLPASYGDVAGEFAIVLRGVSATPLPDERALFGRINADANQPITRAVAVFGSVGTTAAPITDAHSFYGTAPVLSAPGTIANSVTARFDQPSSATTINRALHAGGESSFGNTMASPRVLIDQAAGGGVNLLTGVLKVASTQVVGAQGAAVADATGGATIDAEARTALNALLARLRSHGMIAT